MLCILNEVLLVIHLCDINPDYREIIPLGKTKCSFTNTSVRNFFFKFKTVKTAVCVASLAVF